MWNLFWILRFVISMVLESPSILTKPGTDRLMCLRKYTIFSLVYPFTTESLDKSVFDKIFNFQINLLYSRRRDFKKKLASMNKREHVSKVVFSNIMKIARVFLRFFFQFKMQYNEIGVKKWTTATSLLLITIKHQVHFYGSIYLSLSCCHLSVSFSNFSYDAM